MFSYLSSQGLAFWDLEVIDHASELISRKAAYQIITGQLSDGRCNYFLCQDCVKLILSDPIRQESIISGSSLELHKHRQAYKC